MTGIALDEPTAGDEDILLRSALSSVLEISQPDALRLFSEYTYETHLAQARWKEEKVARALE